MLRYVAFIAVLFVSCAALAQEPAPPHPVAETIVDGAFTIRPAEYVFYKFTVPADVTEVTVRGRFEASGASGNDVEVYVFDEDGYAKWQNGREARPYHASGRVTQANVEAKLPSHEGTYYLVFSNRFSVEANKAVTADMSIGYFE